MAEGLREERFAALLDNMLTLWEATDFTGCATWFERSQQVEAVFGAVEHRVDLVLMNYAVCHAIAPDARFDWPLRQLVDPQEARAIFLANMRRVMIGAAGVWQKDNIEIARSYFE
ncbi:MULTISPECIES: hypothetical protein [unclassified Caulobacter]|uniref:hypothetical protein n=1 Tax=unclassified Caulobacter TaxID=2648921 RepID=UPI000D35037F|nr:MULTISPECIES: hypothetical protein [unclassified Caulobacter]PTS90692.1 hypothetical protein DBR21_03310 [Caulobacter sp. HMWF009]PTT13084.1 hypothetical protein DBR10_00485 [Caulobacter sp. HMWF025]